MDGLSLAKSIYYAEMLKQFKTLKASHTWSILQGHWKTYQVKAYNKSYKQELREDNEQKTKKNSY